MPSRRNMEDHEPLLPQYNDDTALQKRLHQKLHSYQQWRALVQGYMPSTEQLIVNLRTILALDLLNPHDSSVSDSGRLLARYTRQFLHQAIDTLQHKNDQDQIQDFIWLLVHSRVSVDIKDLGKRAQKAQSRAKLAGAYESLRTVAGFLFTNSDFRIFVADLQTVGRQIFKDFAVSVEHSAEQASKSIDVVGEDVKQRGASSEPSTTLIERTDQAAAPTKDDLTQNAGEIVSTLAHGASQVSQDTRESLSEHLTGQEREVLLSRLKKSIGKLRYQKDYTDSVSMLSTLIQRYALTYSRAVEDTLGAAQDDVNTNDEMQDAAENFWSFLKSFGSAQEWERLEQKWKVLLEHKDRDPEFERSMTQIGNLSQKLLTDPESWNNIDEKVSNLDVGSSKTGENASSLRDDIRALLEQAQRTLVSLQNDQDVSKMWSTALKLLHILSPEHSTINRELYYDLINYVVPGIIQLIQYIPIPRLEVSAPEVDLLLENLILEPGKNVNNSSFLPFRLRIETENDVELRKARTRMHSHMKTKLSIKLDGMTVRGDEIGFWLRAHSGIIRLADEGIASFHMDERGMDVQMDVEVGASSIEHILTLKAVKVKIHKLTYHLRKSKWSWLAWLLKPVLQPIVRKVIERQVSNAIADFVHAFNREIVFARERLRATRIADPQDLATFFKAVMTRLTPEPDPDVDVRVGITQPGKGVFKGVYAPGSITKLWHEEAHKAPEVIEDYDKGGWRNEIFDIIR